MKTTTTKPLREKSWRAPKEKDFEDWNESLSDIELDGNYALWVINNNQVLSFWITSIIEDIKQFNYVHWTEDANALEDSSFYFFEFETPYEAAKYVVESYEDGLRDLMLRNI